MYIYRERCTDVTKIKKAQKISTTAGLFFVYLHYILTTKQ
jgi:hypothetical protein